jgi:hypothetical protein
VNLMQLTRAGVSYNLYKSPHLLEMEYEGVKVVYHFSSQSYRVKFLSRCGENRESINQSLSKRFGFNVEAEALADLKLYATIEKRGFLISINGDYIECQNDIILDGLKMIQKS